MILNKSIKNKQTQNELNILLIFYFRDVSTDEAAIKKQKLI
jgi:hypothetical protein